MEERSSVGAKIRTVIAWVTVSVCAIVGIAAAVLAVYIGVNFHKEAPILLAKPEAATAQLNKMLDAVCSGNFTEASSYMLGTPSLGAEEAPEDALSQMLWNAWKTSICYELTGDCHTTNAGLAQDITITYLDIDSVTASLREDSEALMAQRVAEAEDVSEIYDANNEYRQDFVMDILCDAAQASLEKNARNTSITVTANMTYQDGQWWILAEEPLLHAISGSILY